MLIGREKEWKKVEELLKAALKGGSDPLSIYIGGTPGTGKTATVRLIIQDLQRTLKAKFSFLTIDGFEISTAADLYRQVLSQLDIKASIPANKLAAHLKKTFTNETKPIIILMDEIDRISATRPDTLICNAFGWPEFSNGKVIVIGISNALDLVDRVLPKLRASSFPPKVITFSPYSKEQLINILGNKMAKEGVDEKAIELCARKVSALTGDVRRAFHIADGVLNAINEDVTNNENVKPLDSENNATINLVEMTTIKKSACGHVLKEINKVYASPLLRAQLPLHPRILLATFMRLVSQPQVAPKGKRLTNKAVVTRNKLLDAYLKVCSVLSYNPLESEELGNAFSVLESQGMIAQKAKNRIAFEVELEIARRVVNDNAILTAIERVELCC